MEQKEPRKRIPIVNNAQPAVVDPLEFKKNKSSDKARRITTINEEITFDLWFDKHYIDRATLGDDSGKREGIDKKTVEILALQSVKHLLFYAAYIKNFTFISNPKEARIHRIICQQDTPEGMVNVVIEVHYHTVRHYEITVITAMRNDSFAIGDGQYAVEMIDDDNSILKRMSKKGLEEISAI